MLGPQVGYGKEGAPEGVEPGFESHLCLLRVVWPRARHCTSLGLHFSYCGIRTIPAEQGFGGTKWYRTQRSVSTWGSLESLSPSRRGQASSPHWDLALTQGPQAGWGHTGKALGEHPALHAHLTHEEVETHGGASLA